LIRVRPIGRIGSAGEQSAERPDEPENRIEQILLDAGEFQQVLKVRAQRPFDIDECGEGVNFPCFKPPPPPPPGQPFCTPRGGLFIVGPIYDEIGH
jgi:hypothetical protein